MSQRLRPGGGSHSNPGKVLLISLLGLADYVHELIIHNLRLQQPMENAVDTQPTNRYGWPVIDWAAAAGISRASTWNLIKENRVESVKFLSRRLVLTHPKDFLLSLRGAA